MDTLDTSKFDAIYEMGLQYAPKLVMAILVLLVGLWVINKLVDIIAKAMERGGVSRDIQPFLQSMIGVMLKVMLLFSVAGIVGIETTSFVAVLAAAGFAIGMALQGSLGNFAAGVMILIFKPYRVDDVIQIGDDLGHVSEIQIFHTIIKTFDNKMVIVPNGTAISDVITNFSSTKNIRVDMNINVPFDVDMDKVIGIIKEALLNTPKVLKDPAPVVGINEFDSHYIQMAMWPYCEVEDYWDVYFDAKKNVLQALGRNNIKVAYSEGVEMGDIGK